jgi:hypothetical protein
LDKLLDPFALEQQLGPFLVDGSAQLVLLRKKNRVRLGRKGEAALLEQIPQLLDLPGSQSGGVRIQSG